LAASFSLNAQANSEEKDRQAMSEWDRMADKLIRAQNAGEAAARVCPATYKDPVSAAEAHGFPQGTADANAFMVSYLRAIPLAI
jgi:hypothetical protein